MLKLNKKHLIFISLVFFIFTHKVSADVFINEVQVLPSNGRFIELYNSGGDMSLTDWSIKRRTTSGTEYTLVSASRLKGKIIPSGKYFILANESNYAGGFIPDATWAKSYDIANDNMIYLYDGNGNIVSKIGWGKVNDCDEVCPPNPSVDKSIQRTSNLTWIIDSSTPSEINSSGGIDASNNSQDDSNNTDSSLDNSSQSFLSGSSSKTEEQKIYKITTKIISPKIVTAGIPFTIDHQTTGVKNEKVILGKFVWNFGDGMVTGLNSSPNFEYTYKYVGDYVLTLSFYDSILDSVPDAIDRVIIKVISSGIVISSVGDQNDPYVEIENNSNYEILLNGFILKGKNHSFSIPGGIVILPNKKLKLSPRITGFGYSDLSLITISDQSGQIFAKYPKQNYRNVINGNYVKSDSLTNNQLNNEEDFINLNNLGTSVADSNQKIIFSNKIYYWLGLFFIIIIGIVSIVLIRREKNYPDYVEKEISAKDMTIIE